MSALRRQSIQDLVHEIVEITPSPPLNDGPETNGYAVQVEAALSRAKVMESNLDRSG